MFNYYLILLKELRYAKDLTLQNLNLKCIAFSDGIPTICLFTNSEGYIEALQNDQVERIHAAWLSSQYLEVLSLNMDICLLSDLTL